MKLKQTGKRVFGLLLAFAMAFTSFVSTPAEMTVQAASETQYGQQSNIQDGVTLQCWNWSYKNIEANMEKIAQLGYTAIQTSPIQQAKEGTTGKNVDKNWWVYYQPASFSIDNTGTSALGTKAEFESMCRTAHSYGVKVIVDIVANHMGNRTGNNLADTIIADIKNDSSCWHDISKSIPSYDYRYDITQYCMGKQGEGLPDLNTANSKVQNYVIGLLKECIDAGADGFRFDAAKHIETPDDSSYGCGSNFWPNVINTAKSYASSTRGIDLYCYGEILDNPDGKGALPISAYTKYMSVTDNVQGNNLRNYVNDGNATGAGSSYYPKGATANKLVLWAESHDTYADNVSSWVSTYNINKAWALVAARADAMGLYFARPNSRNTILGVADVTGWSYDEVGAANKFHNAFVGQKEYMSSENGVAYCERGTSGVVLVNCNGGARDINVAAHTMAAGTYKDQITGNIFTVANGRITGNMGNTGIAVVYNAEPIVTDPEITLSQEGGTFSSDTLSVTITLKNATSGTVKIGNDSETTFTGNKTFTIGANMGIGDSVTVYVTAKNDSKQVSDSYTFTKVEKSENVAYIKLPSGWGTPVYCYAYDSATETKNNGAWPGVAMTEVGDGIYMYEVAEDIEAPRVIFYSSDSNRYPADMEKGLLLEGSMIYENGAWTTYSPVSKGTVTVEYLDADGKELADTVTMTGKVGDSYTTTSKTIDGYTLKETVGNANGTYTEETITVQYIYEKKQSVGTSYTAYIQKPDGWGSSLYCYVYSENDESNTNGSWPGAAMTNVSGNIYKYQVSSDIENPLVIFSDGSNQYPGSMQKGLSLTDNMIYKNGNWTLYEEEQPTGNVAYIEKDSSWGSTMYCYVYSENNESVTNGSWPGATMTNVSGNLYKYEVSSDIENPLVIFTDGNNQYPGSMEKGLSLSGSMIYKNGNWTTY